MNHILTGFRHVLVLAVTQLIYFKNMIFVNLGYWHVDAEKINLADMHVFVSLQFDDIYISNLDRFFCCYSIYNTIDQCGHHVVSPHYCHQTQISLAIGFTVHCSSLKWVTAWCSPVPSQQQSKITWYCIYHSIHKGQTKTGFWARIERPISRPHGKLWCLNSQKTPHTSPIKVRYGAPILQKTEL